MTDLLVTATLDPASGFDFDTAVNSFAFKSDVGYNDAIILDIFNAVSQFYSGQAPTQAFALGAWMSSALDRSVGACKLRMYDITDKLQAVADPVTGRMKPPPHGSPIAESAFTLTASNQGGSLPSQIAAVVTLRGRDALAQPVEAAPNLRPRQKRTGRLYIGPLATGASDGGAAARLDPTFRSDVLKACEGLQDALVDGDYVWSVWSRSAGALFGIERAEIDDSFDVLRSRQLAPTVRENRTFVPEPSLVLGA